MAITYKDINQLSQKSVVSGTEKIPVSDMQYITPYQIITQFSGNTVAVNFDLNNPPSFSTIVDLVEDGFTPVLLIGGANIYFPTHIDTVAEEALFFQVGYFKSVSCIEYDGSDWSGSTFVVPTIHSGTSDPSNSLGSNGDIYIKLSS